jgi:hypothetical protein
VERWLGARWKDLPELKPRLPEDLPPPARAKATESVPSQIRKNRMLARHKMAGGRVNNFFMINPPKFLNYQELNASFMNKYNGKD